MCGRTTLTITPEDLERTFGFPVPADYRPRYNIAPTQALLALSDQGGERGLRWYRWGLVPYWAKDLSVGNRMINARAETVQTKAAFRWSFENRRCLVVVDGFYEWQKRPEGKQPYRIRSRTRGAFTLAGLWDRWRKGPELVESCTIVTTPASSFLQPIHDRMPVIIDAADRDRWLAADADPGSLLRLLEPRDRDDLEAYAVSTLVNDPANDVEECLDPDEPLTFA